MNVFDKTHPQLESLIHQYPDVFQSSYPQDWKSQRDLVQKQFEIIHRSGLITIEDYKNPDKMFHTTEHIHYINPSLAIKLGVNYILFGGALYFLGTQFHHEILKQFLKGEITGCFAMTEFGIGSDVKHLQTTIRQSGQQFIIHTPDDMARKCWIGGGLVASHSVVFGQLYDEDGTHQGIACVLVDLKTKGVEIQDMGAKLGLNGVDNVTIRFDNVQVPIHYLLNKYGGYNESGKYQSSVKNPNIRFAKMLSALSIGRFSIALGSYAIVHRAYQIALDYNKKRTQFGKPLLEYPTQRNRFQTILDFLCEFRGAFRSLLDLYRREGITKRVHALSALLKVYSSYHAVKYTAVCREMCGGHGYLWNNEIGMLMNDVQIYITFEGDNTVLLQQGVKWILDEFRLSDYVRSRERMSIAYQIQKLISQLALHPRELEKTWHRMLPLIQEIGLQWTQMWMREKAQRFTDIVSSNKTMNPIYLKSVYLTHYPNQYVKLVAKL